MPFGRYPSKVKDFRAWSSGQVAKAELSSSATTRRKSFHVKRRKRRRRRKKEEDA